MNQNPQVAQDQLDAFLRLINQPPTLPASEAVDELIAASPETRQLQRAGVTRRWPQGQRKQRRKMTKASRKRNRR